MERIAGKQAWIAYGRGNIQHFSEHQLLPISGTSRDRDHDEAMGVLSPYLTPEGNGQSVNLTEMVSSFDPRNHSPQFLAAKRKEMKGL